MASNTAEHFVVTNELGGSTTGERAASLASGHRSAPRFC